MVQNWLTLSDLPLACGQGRGGIEEGVLRRAAKPPTAKPQFLPLPSPAAEGLGPKGLRPEGERERGTNDSEIFMNLGAGGGVRARRNFYARKKCQHISLEN
jgi:hypothetical protein